MIQFKQYALGLCAALVATTSLISCGKDNDSPTPAAYPKTVTIEYKLSSPNIQKCDVIYVNESGGQSTIDDADLPFSKKFQRSVNQYDNISLNGSAFTGGSITAEILVNNQVVATKTGTGTSNVSATAVHVFP